MSAAATTRPRLTATDDDAPIAPPIGVARLLPVYVAAIAGAEALVAFVDPLAGAVVDAVMILVILNHYALVARSADGRANWRLATLPVLALLPLLRLISLSMPLTELSQTYWPLAVGVPVLTAAVLVIRALGLSAADVGLRLAGGPWQVGAAVSGIPLGLAAYYIVDPAPLEGTGGKIALQVGILVVFGAFTEELVFRGLAQLAFDGVLAVPGFIWSTLLFALVYMGSQPAALLALLVGVGLLFGWVVRMTGSILGVAVGHALLLVSLLVVWPSALAGS